MSSFKSQWQRENMTLTCFQTDPYTWKPIEPSQNSINYIQVLRLCYIILWFVINSTIQVLRPLELISQHQHSAAAYKQINLVSINIIMFSFKTSDVVEKPWKKKKYEKTKSYSRQKLRKEDWMKKASAKEDRVFRYLLMMMSLIKMMMDMMTAASLLMTGIWEGYSEKALSCRFNQNFPLFVSPPPIHWASLLVFGTR